MNLKQPVAFLGSLAVIATAIVGLSALASASGTTTASRTSTAQATSTTATTGTPTAAAAAASASSPARPMSADGCTFAPKGYVCGGVFGFGLSVLTANVVRGKGGTDFVCNYQGMVRVYNSAGKRIYFKKSSRYQGCTPLRAWFKFTINKKFPNNSKLCTSFYEHGQRQGTVCFKIHK